MLDNEFKKVYLEIDSVYRSNGELFGKEWDKVRRKQMGFLLERPLLFKVQTEKTWGPQRLDVLWTGEWWEAEQEMRNSSRNKEIEELADMALLFLTFDSLNPALSSTNQNDLAKMGWEDTVTSYCSELELDKNSLIPIVEKKIKINQTRNPKEAFMLIDNEDMQTSVKRMEHNWRMLKEKRDKPINIFVKKKDWWKKWLFVDEGGWVRDINYQCRTMSLTLL